MAARREGCKMLTAEQYREAEFGYTLEESKKGFAVHAIVYGLVMTCLIAVNASTGDISWQIPLGITEQLPAGKQDTGRPVLAGPIVSGGGVLFIASTDDNRFRAFDAGTGRQLWVTKLDRRGNANPITYQGRDGKQYLAIVATDTLKVYALP